MGHYINWVELYAGDRYIGKVEFAPVVSDGYEFNLKVSLEESGNLVARSFCNLHGLWEGKGRKVTVTG
ncbi:MAG: desulfoferrodoxin family protein [Candidatus Bathyarchaeia archaeon]